MPRWKALPEELDPQSREFTGRLRGLVDRSGLSLAAVAARTGYSKTSWERYLSGRLLAPKGAIVALAEVTGTEQRRLTAMWEPAERAWSRSEMRHEMTMEAIRTSQARAALGGEAGVAAAPATGGRAGGPGGDRTGAPTPAGSGREGLGPGRPLSVPVPQDARPGVPRPGSAPDSGGDGHRTGGDGPGGRPEDGRRRTTLFLAGLGGALLLTAGAVLLTGPDGDEEAAVATPSTGPGTGVHRSPAGDRCTGADCTGKDPEAMGCGGQFAGTVARAAVGGGLVEVRYSETCEAAWARITQASPGDTVRITAGSSEQDGTVEADADAYTPMVAVEKASDARACAVLASGTTGCIAPG